MEDGFTPKKLTNKTKQKTEKKKASLPLATFSTLSTVLKKYLIIDL